MNLGLHPVFHLTLSILFLFDGGGAGNTDSWSSSSNHNPPSPFYNADDVPSAFRHRRSTIVNRVNYAPSSSSSSTSSSSNFRPIRISVDRVDTHALNSTQVRTLDYVVN